MVILGVDQATNCSGFSLMNSNMELLDYGVINLSEMPKGGDQEQTAKRYQLISEIKNLVWKYKVSQVITEGIYAGKENLKTYKMLAQTQSALQDFCFRHEIICF